MIIVYFISEIQFEVIFLIVLVSDFFLSRLLITYIFGHAKGRID